MGVSIHLKLSESITQKEWTAVYERSHIIAEKSGFYDYGKKEVTDPTRIVTSTVRVQGGTLPVVSVKTRGDIPKSSVMDCVLAESYVK